MTLPPEGVVAPEAPAPTVGYLPREDGWGSIHDIATDYLLRNRGSRILGKLSDVRRISNHPFPSIRLLPCAYRPYGSRRHFGRRHGSVPIHSSAERSEGRTQRRGNPQVGTGQSSSSIPVLPPPISRERKLHTLLPPPNFSGAELHTLSLIRPTF